MSRQPVTSLLVWASGHTVAEVDEHGDRLHYKRAGALVLVATGIAFVVALAFLFFGVDPVDGPVARGVQIGAFVVVAALVASAICAMDRWIVATVYDRDSVVFRLMLLGVRVLVSVPMALLAAFTLTPLLAAGPVDQELARQHDAEAAQLVANPLLVTAEERAREQVDELGAAVARAQATYDAALFALSKEESGLGPSARAGCGAACRANQASVGQARAALVAAQQEQRTQTPVRQAAVVAAQQATAADLTQRREVIDDNDDVFARHNALRAVSDRDPSIRYLALIIELLLITIDLLPALLKALSPRTRLETAQVAERMRFTEQQRAQTAAAREALADGSLLSDRRAEHALTAELQGLDRDTSREIARLEQQQRRELAASRLDVDAQIEAARREAHLQVEQERQRALLAIEAERQAALREVEAARTEQTRLAGLAAAGTRRWTAPPEESASTPWWRRVSVPAIGLALVLLTAVPVALLLDDDDAPAGRLAQAPSVATTAPSPSPSRSVQPIPTISPLGADEPGAPAPVFLAIEGRCDGNTTELVGISSNFTPDGGFRTETQRPDGSALDDASGSTGTAGSDGTIRWTFPCADSVPGTYRTRVIDLTTQRDTGWIAFQV